MLDTVGNNLPAFRQLLTPTGRMVTIIFDGFGDVVYILASTLFGQRRVRFVQKPPTRALLASLTEYVEKETIKPIIDSVYVEHAARHLACLRSAPKRSAL